MMRTKEFQALAEELEKLTSHQRTLLTERLQKIGHIQTVQTLVESRALTTPTCPKCGHDEIARWGSASGLQRYRRCLQGHIQRADRDPAGTTAP